MKGFLSLVQQQGRENLTGSQMQAFEAIQRNIERGDFGAEACELGSLAAGGGAEVKNMISRTGSDQARWQAGRGILHPPFAGCITRQVLDPAARRSAQCTRRQNGCAEFRGPAVRSGRILQGDVEGGLGQ